jgi:hypothetical protein
MLSLRMQVYLKLDKERLKGIPLFAVDAANSKLLGIRLVSQHAADDCTLVLVRDAAQLLQSTETESVVQLIPEELLYISWLQRQSRRK